MNLSISTTAVELKRTGPQVLVQNLGPGNLYVSFSSDVSASNGIQMDVFDAIELPRSTFGSIYLVSDSTADARLIGGFNTVAGAPVTPPVSSGNPDPALINGSGQVYYEGHAFTGLSGVALSNQFNLQIVDPEFGDPIQVPSGGTTYTATATVVSGPNIVSGATHSWTPAATGNLQDGASWNIEFDAAGTSVLSIVVTSDDATHGTSAAITNFPTTVYADPAYPLGGPTSIVLDSTNGVDDTFTMTMTNFLSPLTPNVPDTLGITDVERYDSASGFQGLGLGTDLSADIVVVSSEIDPVANNAVVTFTLPVGTMTAGVHGIVIQGTFAADDSSWIAPNAFFFADYT